ncbi:MAG: PilZ domain-containing protein [Acidobacteria bacterium]|nr:PilZ domain-containing protein [Acidobacteriota bacterium]
MYTASDRRQYPRIAVEQIVTLTCATCPADTAAVTQNLSLGGVLLRTSNCVEVDTEVGLTLVFPVEITHTREIHIVCRGRVLRREQFVTRSAIAVEFKHYEPLPQYLDEVA